MIYRVLIIIDHVLILTVFFAGPTLDNTLAPMILFQWNSAGILDVLNGKFKSKSNVFLYSSDIGSVYETLIDALSMPESTVLDVVSNNCK